MFKALNDLEKPVIARVQGNVFGGGVGLLCIADVAVAADISQVRIDGDAARTDPGDHQPLCGGADRRGTGAALVHVRQDF
jgi:1,4-dihydroxy-2-naphthoyl-CoA synthase